MIAFRFNSNEKIGFGHYVRCNEIALVLNGMGYKTLAILDESSELNTQISASAFHATENISANSDVDETIKIYKQYQCSALLVDHYHCKKTYQTALLGAGIVFGQYDYQCAGAYLGKFIININPAASSKWYADSECEESLKYLCGTKYAVLKHDSSNDKVAPNILNKLDQKADSLKRLLVCLGGGDDGGLLFDVVNALQDLSCIDEVHVACGSKSSSINDIEALRNSKIHMHVNCNYMYELMKRCNAAVCAAGTLSYELAYSGVPFVVGYFAENQKKLAASWAEFSGLENVGDFHSLDNARIRHAVSELLTDVEKAVEKCQLLSESVDGKAAWRLANNLVNI